jgi:hypothetical protein
MIWALGEAPVGGSVHVDEKLKIESNPFVARASGGRVGRPLQKTLGEVIRQIGFETPTVVVSGSPGTGKTLLAQMATRACADLGLSVRRIHRGDLVDVAAGERSDLLLVDEADSMPDSTLHMLLFEGDKRPAITTVLLCLPASVPRFGTVADAVVELTRLSLSDTRLYLQERATRASFPGLFTPTALDLIVDASRGLPRSLWSIAGLAYFFAASAGASQISRQNVADALASQMTRPEIPDAAVPTAPSVNLVTETPVGNPAPPSVADPSRASANVAVFPGGIIARSGQIKRVNSDEAPVPPVPRSEPEEALVRSTSAAVTPIIGTVIKGPGPVAEPVAKMPKSIAAAPDHSVAPDDEWPIDSQKVGDALLPQIAHYETIAVPVRDARPVFVDATAARVSDRLPVVESIAGASAVAMPSKPLVEPQAEPAIRAQVTQKATERGDRFAWEDETPTEGRGAAEISLAESPLWRRAGGTSAESQNFARRYRAVLDNLIRSARTRLRHLSVDSMLSRRALATMVFVVIAGATIGVFMPLMLASTRFYSATRLSNAPGSIQAQGFVERTPVLATTVFGEPNLSGTKSAAVGEKELAGGIREAILAGAVETKKVTSMSLTAEEEAAVARGMLELAPQATGQHMPSGFLGNPPVSPTSASNEPVLSDAENVGLAKKERAGGIVVGAAEMKNVARMPLTAEEEAAVARGIRESAPQTVPQTAGQHMLVVVHGVDAHVSPAGRSTVVATLRRGLKVNMIERRGKWTLVEDVGHSAAPKRGWVFNTFLDDGDR